MPDEPSLMSIEEAARYLNVSKTSLRRWTNDGTLPCVRVGSRRERRFRRRDLDQFLSGPDPHRVGCAEGEDRLDLLSQLRTAEVRGRVPHVCSLFRSRDELWAMFKPYVVEHLESRSPILYIHDEDATEDVVGRFRNVCGDLDARRADRSLRLLKPSEAYLRTGEFSALRMLDFVESVILNARSLGQKKQLISGEMSWYLTGAKGHEQMSDYEMRLNDLMTRYPQVTIVCHYDVRRLGAEVVLDGLCSHPHVQLSDRLVSGFL